MHTFNLIMLTAAAVCFMLDAWFGKNKLLSLGLFAWAIAFLVAAAK